MLVSELACGTRGSAAVCRRMYFGCEEKQAVSGTIDKGPPLTYREPLIVKRALFMTRVLFRRSEGAEMLQVTSCKYVFWYCILLPSPPPSPQSPSLVCESSKSGTSGKGRGKGSGKGSGEGGGQGGEGNEGDMHRSTAISCKTVKAAAPSCSGRAPI